MKSLVVCAALSLAFAAAAIAEDAPPAAPEPIATQLPARQFILFFEHGEIPTPSEADPILPQIAEVFKRVGYAAIAIECHSDQYKTPEEGIAISTKRADFVKSMLVMYGVKGELITATGVGFTEPLVPGVTPAVAVSNRRCMINLT